MKMIDLPLSAKTPENYLIRQRMQDKKNRIIITNIAAVSPTITFIGALSVPA